MNEPTKVILKHINDQGQIVEDVFNCLLDALNKIMDDSIPKERFLEVRVRFVLITENLDVLLTAEDIQYLRNKWVVLK